MLEMYNYIILKMYWLYLNNFCKQKKRFNNIYSKIDGWITNLKVL